MQNSPNASKIVMAKRARQDGEGVNIDGRDIYVLCDMLVAVVKTTSRIFVFGQVTRRLRQASRARWLAMAMAAARATWLAAAALTRHESMQHDEFGVY